ncbi:MAG TPA: putative molybdenum carrier protein [Thermoanaerobaculaceae bacterium]|nr:putative molybdenum carrier protein [Thermoanaerobaculaceae bacterium]
MSGDVRPGPLVRRLVSGGQTGVDRAALDAAISLGIPCGGWCPRGRRAEAAPIPDRYPLQETPTAAYPERTAWNVRDSDGTLVLTRGAPRGGTALTVRLARRARKPVLVVDLDVGGVRGDVEAWLAHEAIGTLNVAGPRESEAPGIHAQALAFLVGLLGPRG